MLGLVVYNQFTKTSFFQSLAEATFVCAKMCKLPFFSTVYCLCEGIAVLDAEN